MSCRFIRGVARFYVPRRDHHARVRLSGPVPAGQGESENDEHGPDVDRLWPGSWPWPCPAVGPFPPRGVRSPVFSARRQERSPVPRGRTPGRCSQGGLLPGSTLPGALGPFYRHAPMLARRHQGPGYRSSGSRCGGRTLDPDPDTLPYHPAGSGPAAWQDPVRSAGTGPVPSGQPWHARTRSPLAILPREGLARVRLPARGAGARARQREYQGRVA